MCMFVHRVDSNLAWDHTPWSNNRKITRHTAAQKSALPPRRRLGGGFCQCQNWVCVCCLIIVFISLEGISAPLYTASAPVKISFFALNRARAREWTINNCDERAFLLRLAFVIWVLWYELAYEIGFIILFKIVSKILSKNIPTLFWTLSSEEYFWIQNNWFCRW